MLGLALDPERRILWATTEGLPQARGLPAADRGRAAVLQYDLDSGRQLRRYDLPDDGQRHEPGDIALGPGGDLYVSDGGFGAVYVARPAGSGLETLVERGAFFASPQGPAATPDGRRLFVADYARGIGVVDLASRTRDFPWQNTKRPSEKQARTFETHRAVGAISGPGPRCAAILGPTRMTIRLPDASTS